MVNKVIIFDTETTGLPKSYKKSALEEPNNWPDLVSICWMVFADGIHAYTENFIIRPDNWTITEESSKFHGITQEHALLVGRPLEEVLNKFRADLVGCNRLVAHNLHFDSNVMQAAYKWRLGTDPTAWWPTESHFCSMLTATPELKIPSKYPKPTEPYKWPGLDELYRATFNEEPPANAHSADRDVNVLQKIYWKRWAQPADVKNINVWWRAICAIQ